MDRDLEQDFTAFVRARTAALFRTAMAFTGHRQQAEDLLQTALLKTLPRWREVRQGNPDAYVRRVMYLSCVSRWRRRSHGREVLTDEVPEAGRGDGTDLVDLRLAVRASLLHLAPKHRAVLVLRYLEDLTDADIAGIVGCKETTVRSQIARALDRLRERCPELNHPVETEVHR